ncbi:hypothetical protein ACH4VM_25625 [Streptomyces sp. NPDC020792]|uniref:hypothetical protein n=1 Tax=Streptomyces sp. NPDC020792 TaxID=3365089 RepID=UPI0037A1EB80
MLLALLLVASLLGRSAAGVASSPTGRRTTCASRVASVRPGRYRSARPATTDATSSSGRSSRSGEA